VGKGIARPVRQKMVCRSDYCGAKCAQPQGCTGHKAALGPGELHVQIPPGMLMHMTEGQSLRVIREGAYAVMPGSCGGEYLLAGR
jgi:hypothetical protein